MAREPLKGASRTVRKGSLPAWAKAGGAVGEQGGRSKREYRFSGPMAGIFLAGAVVLIAAAFGLGWQMSQKATTRKLMEKHKQEIDRITASIMGSKSSVGNNPSESAADPRQVGLNYVRLCQVPTAEGEKYAGFLATEGLHTWREPLGERKTKSGRVQMVTLYAVNQGFAGNERVEIEKCRAALLALGDKWARKNRGGNPFGSLMLEKYKGPSPAP